jgi:DnaJ-class molecular chaperone
VAVPSPRRDPSNTRVQDLARDSRKRAKESHIGAGELDRKVPIRFSPSPSLKSLYREVARKIHPDLATDESDRDNRHVLMAEANKAYEEGNEARLRAILEEYESRPESFAGEGIAAELIRMIRKIAQIRKRLSEIDEELARLQKSDQAQLKSKVDAASVDGRDLLQEMAKKLDLQIAVSRERLQSFRER